jgi:hypothetical protein
MMQLSRDLRSWLSIGLIVLFLTPPILAQDQGSDTTAGLKLESVRRVWGHAPHNAFTDLIRFKGDWYLTFREASAHGLERSHCRVIRSSDTRQWESVARFASKPGRDLRDPKLSITPTGQLMLNACSRRTAEDHRGECWSVMWRSNDGNAWRGPNRIGDKNYWLWRVFWHRGKGYATGYHFKDGDRHTRLYVSDNETDFEPLVDRWYTQGMPGEADLVFAEDDTAYCLLRRRGSARLGQATPPYDDWQWRALTPRIGGPEMIQLKDGRLLAAVRMYQPTRTSLAWINPDNASFTEALRLPSGGDTSYASIVQRGGKLWVSYYSSHEDKTAIYLARLKLVD